MTSRRKRKKQQRERQLFAEATASPQRKGLGWGHGYPTRNSDLVMLRRAINEDWDISPEVRASILREINEEISTAESSRRILAVAKCHIAMIAANNRARKAQLGIKPRRGRPPKKKTV